MKKLWTALLLIAVLLGLLNAAAVAEKMENVKISDVEYYQPSGCLKGFTLHYTMSSGHANDFRVAVQKDLLEDALTNLGSYWSINQYSDWPSTPGGCGFTAWAGGSVTKPGKGQTETHKVTFDDGKIDCKTNQTYHLYLWTKFNDGNNNGNYKVYPDAYVTTFKTGNRKIEGDAVENHSVQPKAPTNDSSNIPPKAPTNDSSNIPPKGPTNDSSNIPPSNSSNAAQDIPATVDLPKTGDDSQMVLWLAMSLLAGAGLLALTRRRASER